MKIRIVTLNDAPELLAIYSQYIASDITFENELPSEAAFKQRINDICSSYPYLVLEKNDQIIGYAYAHRIQSREAFQWGAELSIYLDQKSSGRGLGTKLYTRLINTLKSQGVRTVYGCVTSSNLASEKFHEKLGFSRIGTFHNAGFKNGLWHGITWFEKVIGSYDDTPTPLIPFSEIELLFKDELK